jgi:hypothetical protein
MATARLHVTTTSTTRHRAGSGRERPLRFLCASAFPRSCDSLSAHPFPSRGTTLRFTRIIPHPTPPEVITHNRLQPGVPEASDKLGVFLLYLF